MTLSADEEINLCTVLLVIMLAIYHNSLQQRKYLKRTALVHPKKSAWQHLLDNGDSSSFLLLTGVNRRAFICSLILSFLPSIACAVIADKEGNNGHYPRRGNLVCCCFIWAAQCRTSICVFFLASHHQHVLGY